MLLARLVRWTGLILIPVMSLSAVPGNSVSAQAAEPGITLISTSAIAGTSETVTGSGFSPGEIVTITFDGYAIPSSSGIIAGSNGDWTGTFIVPKLSSASFHQVSAYGSRTPAGSVAPVTILVTPYIGYVFSSAIALSLSSGSVGSSVTVTGTGFILNNPITITFGGTPITTPEVSVSSFGTFTTKFTVPVAANGPVTVKATGGTVSASATFTVLSGMSLNVTSAEVGALVTATGTGFRSGGTVSLSLSRTQVATATTDTNGNFTATFNIPSSTGGSHTIRAYDGVNSATAAFNTESQLIVSPTSGSVGSQVTVNGNGYGSDASVSVSFDNTRVATASADVNGSFGASFKVPATTRSVHTVTATDGVNSASGQFTTSAKISLNPKSGPTGDRVTISGDGFIANAGVTVNFNNSQVKKSTADANGALLDRFVVPDLDVGNYAVSASDGTNSASTAFSVTSSMKVTPAIGNVGSQITVTGAGFDGAVTLEYDNSKMAATTAGTNGSFTATFSAPVSIHGDHVVLATDGTLTLRRTFSISSTPPPVPRLLLPASGSTQSFRPTFTWTSVSDPNGVTYVFQLATDPSFTSPLVTQTGLATPQYSLTSSQSLKGTSSNAPYYWRVKAVDQASNESEFTMPNTFVLSTFPAWALWLLVAVGAVIVMLLVLWLGRRMGRRTTE